MTSLAEDAYVGTLHYKTLDPPISVGGGVQNPMDANLDGGNFNITNVNALTTGTLNYTTLNPPLPTSGVDNPMLVNLDGGNFNITNVGILNTNGAITAGGNINGGEIIASSKLEGASGLVSGNWEVGGNLSVDAPGVTTLRNTTIDGNCTFGDTKLLTMPGNSGISCQQFTARTKMIKESYTFNPPTISTTGNNNFTLPAGTNVARVIIKSTIVSSMTGFSGNIIGISASQVSYSTGRVGISFYTGHLNGFPKLVNWTLGQGQGTPSGQANWYYEVNFDADLSVVGKDILLELDFNQIN